MNQQVLLDFYELLKSNKIPIQNIHFITKNLNHSLKNHIILPIPKGKKFFMYINNNNIYLINNSQQLKVKNTQEIDNELNNTIIKGYYEDKFIGYDVLIYKGNNIQAKSYIYRHKCLQNISENYEKCNTVNIHKKQDIQEIIQKYQGILLVPTKAHYINNKTYIYQPPNKVIINFKIKNEYTPIPLYTFLLSNKKPFIGTKHFPSEKLLPLSHYDRNFIKQYPNNLIFEFQWINNNFVPVKPTTYESTQKDAEKAWEYINQPLEYNELLELLET